MLGQLSLSIEKFDFLNPLFGPFLRNIFDTFWDKCVNLGLYINKISILIMINDTTTSWKLSFNTPYSMFSLCSFKANSSDCCFVTSLAPLAFRSLENPGFFRVRLIIWMLDNLYHSFSTISSIIMQHKLLTKLKKHIIFPMV